MKIRKKAMILNSWDLDTFLLLRIAKVISERLYQDKELGKQVREYKDKVKFKSMKWDDLLKMGGDFEYVSIKYDGVLTFTFIKEDQVVSVTKNGLVFWNELFQKEKDKLVKKFGKDVILIGELYGINAENERPMAFNEFMSALHNDFQSPYEPRLAVWEIRAKDKQITDLDEVKKALKGFKYLHVVEYKKNPTKEDLEKLWESIVKKKGYEGFVLKRGSYYIKVKPLLDFDLAVLGYAKTKAVEEYKMVGALVVGFWNGKNWQVVGKVGTGFTDKERREWYDYFQGKKPIYEDDKLILFKPERVIQIEAEKMLKGKNRVIEGNKLKEVQGYTLIKPRFVRIREDKKPKEATVEQFERYLK